MRQIVARTHDWLGLLLDFHWREAIRHDWRSDQVAIIEDCILSGISSLGINSRKGGRGDSPEAQQTNLGGEDAALGMMRKGR